MRLLVAGPYTRSPNGQSKYRQGKTPPNGKCPVCGEIIRRHEKCAACCVLIGHYHTDDRTFSGLCAGCVVQRDSGSQGALQVRIAIEESGSGVYKHNRERGA